MMHWNELAPKNPLLLSVRRSCLVAALFAVPPAALGGFCGLPDDYPVVITASVEWSGSDYWYGSGPYGTPFHRSSEAEIFDGASGGLALPEQPYCTFEHPPAEFAVNYRLYTLMPEDVRTRQDVNPEQRLFDVQGEILEVQEAMHFDVPYELRVPEEDRIEVETKERWAVVVTYESFGRQAQVLYGDDEREVTQNGQALCIGAQDCEVHAPFNSGCIVIMTDRGHGGDYELGIGWGRSVRDAVRASSLSSRYRLSSMALKKCVAGQVVDDE